MNGFGQPDGAAISGYLSEDLVYRMTKILFENWSEVIKGMPWRAEEAGIELAPSLMVAPYHPGAIKYYKERGVWAKYHK